MPTARAHNGDDIYFEVHGEGPALVCYADPNLPVDAPAADLMRRLCTGLREGLTDRHRIVLLSYPGAHPFQTMTPENVTSDLLAVADAAGLDDFTWWGYSWGGVIGLQLALRTDRLTGLAMTGFPPLDGPYHEMLQITLGSAQPSHLDDLGISVEKTTMIEKMRQSAIYYEALQDFDDRDANKQLKLPRLCFAGTDDVIVAGDVVVRIGGIVTDTRPELEDLGWEVHLLDGLDHLGGVEPDVVVPLLRDWMDRAVVGERTAS
ncbi:alpha/beta fold hydrolase [Pseudonocardia parietis]|uniref:Pimeloyl-ACP methyl ester carboxylesterase n=1 Tax=Pseudonocardia parietis TaxID=570936 RepID=A0ABS4VUC2_9PSEU|nr:alpha/beta hydrolase [Pseudonocardia parietis]MBP2367527.1 pimeloyl-ACP methyl ester carboxylesterase [Pseudonocardia parietis]